jgi:hypothetical protein
MFPWPKIDNSPDPLLNVVEYLTPARLQKLLTWQLLKLFVVAFYGVCLMALAALIYSELMRY